jgi:hypothetical protein
LVQKLQKEIKHLKKDNDTLKAKADGYEAITHQKEVELNTLKHRFEGFIKEDEDRRKEAKLIFEQYHGK